MTLRWTRLALTVAALGPAGLSGAAPATAGGRTLGLVPVARGVTGSVFVAPAPSDARGRLYVVQRTGLIRILDHGRLLPEPFLDIRRQVETGGLRGLFSVAFDPDFGGDGRFYVNYVGRDGAVYVTRFRAVHGAGALSSEHVLLRVPTMTNAPYGHYGGELAFGPDGQLYAGFGDAGRGETAQDPATLLGKLVRLDVRKPNPVPEIVAYGLRNPWRMSFDRATGDLYIGDVGESHREEVDRLPRGFRGIANFGWPVWEGSIRTDATSADLAGRVLPPLLEYPHTAKRCYSVVGGYVYRGSALPTLEGRYLYADLCGGVWSVSVRGGVVRDRRVEPLAPPALIVSFGQGAEGELYLVCLNGRVYEIAPAG
jgi:glucose/arabinose dehydrogenase